MLFTSMFLKASPLLIPFPCIGDIQVSHPQKAKRNIDCLRTELIRDTWDPLGYATNSSTKETHKVGKSSFFIFGSVENPLQKY